MLMNSKAESILGVSRNLVMGDHLGELVNSGEWVSKMASPRVGPFEIYLGNGSVIEGSVTPIGGPRERPLGSALVFRDVTDKRRVDENLEKTSRMEAIGMLAGGIAHDFNNKLTVNLGQISIAKAMVKEDKELNGHLLAAENAALEAKELTNQLLVFSRGGAPVKRLVDLGSIIEETTRTVLSGSNCGFSLEIDEEVWPLRADDGQLAQVFTNLLLNAKEATPEGGGIMVRVRNSFVGTTEGMEVPPGKYVRIEVIDHGCGIAPSEIPKIFDPYYTTKENKAGLGLAISHSILRKHEGTIDVDSVLGRGTSLRIFLPVDRLSDEGPVELRRSSMSGNGKVLVMDDEEAVRDVAGDMLRKLGYEVGTVKNGDEALDVYISAMEEGDPFDAVIMDLTIRGGMGGQETISELLKVDPGAKVIVSSGYSDKAIMGNYGEHGFSDVMPKPYDLKELGNKLSRLIDNGD